MRDFKEIKIDITSNEDVIYSIKMYKESKAFIFGFDTETTGLDIKNDKPFLIVFGYPDLERKILFSYSLDLWEADKNVIKNALRAFKWFCDKSKAIVGFNLTFDIHMMDNIDLHIENTEKWRELQSMIRITHEAKTPEKGGPVIKLIPYASKYVDKSFKKSTRDLTIEKKKINSHNTLLLKEKLADQPVPEKYKQSPKQVRWTKGILDKFFDDMINEIEDLPTNVRTIIGQWKEEVKDPDKYYNLPRDVLTKYAHDDLFATLYIFLRVQPLIKKTGQEKAFEIEKKALHGIYTLEKTGVKIDVDYLYKSKQKVKDYIKSLRYKLKTLMGEKVSISQHKRIKEIMLQNYSIHLSSTNKPTLVKALNHEDVVEEAKEVIRIIVKLRSLEKWYSTYLINWISRYELNKEEWYYPQYRIAGTVTGRVSSDFQQFPKKPISTIEDEELFHPRQVFVTPKGYKLYYLDYSAMELRMQANYTMLISGGDLNLCRAYIPLQCTKKDDGKYYLNEDLNKEWHPTDLHGLTAKRAFGVEEEDPDFSSKRTLAKIANFSMVYGATPNTLQNPPLNLSPIAASKLYKAFYGAFPKIEEYVSYVDNSIKTKQYAENLFSRKYLNVSTHEARNYLIQGSCADYLKKLLPQIVEFLSDKKSKIQGYLHDEFSFIIHEEEEHIVKDLRRMMQQLKSPIPMDVDVEVSTTNWREKYDIEIP